jgi:molybdopterin-guanine dinucleotide biosynthesis protein A
MTAPTREQITGLVLAGGRGSRMGGVDKGLQLFRGEALAWHAVQRLAPQVGALLISANRNRDAYAAMGAPVVADALADHAGPLAGLAAALAHCRTPYLASVPCDCPNFPADLVPQLAAALAEDGAEIAVAATAEDGQLRTQPVFSLVHRSLLPGLLAFLQGGQRKMGRWTEMQRTIIVPFHDVAAFSNANTPDELQRLQPGV